MSALLLASASPRRRELLALICPEFDCRPPHIDETPLVGESPADYVERLACEKARAVDAADTIIVAADTTVALATEILGKPRDRSDARTMLRRLSGQTHQVHTGLAIRRNDEVRHCVVTTDVTFVQLSSGLIEHYLDTDEPWDKAGSYGIQGRAGCFVLSINGSYSAVVGLPLAQTQAFLSDFGMAPRWVAGTDG